MAHDFSDSADHGVSLLNSCCTDPPRGSIDGELREKNYDSRYGNGLNGPSRTKILEIVRFMFTIEGREGE
jgi:hypothetical protein